VYIRFVCFQTIEGQEARLGLFQAIDLALDSEQRSDWAVDQVKELYSWFVENLAKPTRLERGSSKRPGQPALSWFKPSATEHVRRMYDLKSALEECGVHIEVLTTREPGVVIYEDEFQLTAEPGTGRF